MHQYKPREIATRSNYITYGTGDTRDPLHMETVPLAEVLEWVKSIEAADGMALNEWQSRFLASIQERLRLAGDVTDAKYGANGARLITGRQRVVIFQIVQRIATRVEMAHKEQK